MISLVIPCYNESDVLDRLFTRVRAMMDASELAMEVVLVDDGSRDDTLEKLLAFHRQDARWKVLSLSRNFGHQAAISAGLYYARGDAVVIMDADLQDPPEIVREFIDRWKAGYHVVYAVRQSRKESLWLRLCYKAFYRMLAYTSTVTIPLDSGDFCLMDRRVVEVINAMPERCRFLRGMRSWVGFKQIGVPYDRDERAAGEPKYTLARLVGLALNGMVSFSYVPLRLASWLGLAVSLFSLAAIFFFILDYFFTFELFGMRVGDIRGRASFLVAIFFVGGAQLLVMGIFGEYLGRVFDETKVRPLWVINRTAGLQAPPDAARGGWFRVESETDTQG